MVLNLDQAQSNHFPKQDTAWGSLFARLDELALAVGAQLTERAARGQFFTPIETARFMAGFFSQRPETLRILDAGAGLGALSAALVEAACHWQKLPNEIHVTAFENDTLLCEHFMQLGLVSKNPDNPTRAVNSPETRYQIEPTFLKLVRSFDRADWDKNLSYYLRSTKRLVRLRARERAMELMPVQLPDGTLTTLARGGQNQLLKQIVEQFCPRFTPNGKILYLGDAGKKFRYLDEVELAAQGVALDKHGKLPDVIVHHKEKQWLVLIEAVTSHGPINLKRHNELQELFNGSKLPLVYVTAFPSRRQMVKYLAELAWETEVWLADTPDHLIHFNGEKFLGPYV